METITVAINWEGDNYSCAWAMEGIGAILVTDESIDKIKAAFAESLRQHIASMVADGDDVSQWLADGDYRIDFVMAG